MDQWNQEVLGLSFYEVLGEKWVLIGKNQVEFRFLVKTLFSIWQDIWSEMEGLRGKMGTKTSESPLQANSFFSAKKVTSRFLGNGIMIFRYF